MEETVRGLARQVSRIDLQQGELYSQHYDQRKELGRGKFGVVYHVKVNIILCPLSSVLWRLMSPHPPSSILLPPGPGDRQVLCCQAHKDQEAGAEREGGGRNQSTQEVFQPPHYPVH